MSMKQLETFMSRVQSNDSIRDEVQRCGKDNSCVVKVGAKHGTARLFFKFGKLGRKHRTKLEALMDARVSIPAL